MNKKKLAVVIVVFIAYSVLLFIISANYKQTTVDHAPSVVEEKVEQDSTAESIVTVAEADDINLLSENVYEAAIIEGKTSVDTPWESNIELLNDAYPEQGLFMMPGTTITYTVQVPENAKFRLEAKIYDEIAKMGISDGVSFVVEVCQDGNSLISYEPIIVDGDGKVTISEIDFAEWQGRTIQLKIHCYDGGNDDANGDWGVIKILHI